MKIKIILLLILLIACSIYARILETFDSWDKIIRDSPSILVVRCGKPTPPYPIINGPRSDSGIDVQYRLKGTNDASRLWTDRDSLHQGENYLVFGYINNEICVALGEFKVVPLGSEFSTNWIAGKSLDEQIQELFKRALDHLDREIKQDQDQKAQLESGIKKP
jgi:hypothetical protein